MGLDWRADVLCRRPGEPWTVALEAQVQLQGEEAYRQRQSVMPPRAFAPSGSLFMSPQLCIATGSSRTGIYQPSKPRSGRIRMAG
jgi:hypothetical protein